jgi:hypothetical protein
MKIYLQNNYMSIKNKTTDVIFSTGKTKDREGYALFSDQYASFPMCR